MELVTDDFLRNVSEIGMRYGFCLFTYHLLVLTCINQSGKRKLLTFTGL